MFRTDKISQTNFLRSPPFIPLSLAFLMSSFVLTSSIFASGGRAPSSFFQETPEKLTGNIRPLHPSLLEARVAIGEDPHACDYEILQLAQVLQQEFQATYPSTSLASYEAVEAMLLIVAQRTQHKSMLQTRLQKALRSREEATRILLPITFSLWSTGGFSLEQFIDSSIPSGDRDSAYYGFLLSTSVTLLESVRSARVSSPQYARPVISYKVSFGRDEDSCDEGEGTSRSRADTEEIRFHAHRLASHTSSSLPTAEPPFMPNSSSSMWGGASGLPFPEIPRNGTARHSDSSDSAEPLSSLSLASSSSAVSPLSEATTGHKYRLQYLQGMSQIDLSNNKLTTEAGNRLLEIAKGNPQLTVINLAQNKIPSELLDALQEQLRKNKHANHLAHETEFELPASLAWGEELLIESGSRSVDERTIIYGLSIDGGGMKGIIPGVFFERAEHIVKQYTDTKRTLADVFEGFAGTSIGGIFALGSAKEVPLPPETFVKLFKKEGKNIFGERLHRRGILGSRYSSDTLESIYLKFFGDERLSGIEKTLIVTGVRTDLPDGLRPYIFDARRAQRDLESDFLLRDVARATSAAPIFFPRAVIRNCSAARNQYEFWDGGVWKNDPSELLLNAMTQRFPESRVKILSFGTGQSAPNYDAIWADGVLGNISPLLFGQIDLSANVSGIMRDRVGNDYKRLQPLLLQENGAPLKAEMDDYSPWVLKRYVKLAEEVWVEERMDEFIRKLCEEVSQKADL